MSNYRPPKREDFDSEERYQEFLEAYEAAVILSEMEDEERRYDSKDN